MTPSLCPLSKCYQGGDLVTVRDSRFSLRLIRPWRISRQDDNEVRIGRMTFAF
jgi:hypothetical protein